MDDALVLPYPAMSSMWRLSTGHGKCIQSVDGASTHRGTLCYSFDFKLKVGTPVLAARGGTIAAVVTHFAAGGTKAHLAPRANFVAVRHDDGSYARYYHLIQHGTSLRVGDHVDARDQIAWSGNTGYTGGPHLHFDTVNCLPEETSELRVIAPESIAKLITSIAAAFSAELAPDCGLQAPLRVDDGLSSLFGCIALADRNPKQSFAARIDQLAARGASAALISNNRTGPEIFSMGGCEKPSKIPAVLISKEDGTWLRRALKTHGEVRLALGAHKAVLGARKTGEVLADIVARYQFEPLSFKYGLELRYVARTLPVEFNIGARCIVPQAMQIYPKPKASDVCCMAPFATEDKRNNFRKLPKPRPRP